MKTKLLLVSLLTLLCTFGLQAQQLIQGTVRPGATASDVEVWLKPNFSNSMQYLFQIGLPIAFPASAVPQPSSITVTLDPGFTAAFGTNYNLTINPVATATGGTEKYFNIVLVRGGAGASNAQSWTSGVEFKVLNVHFNYASGTTTFFPKLADYQDGGGDGQGNFYTQSGTAIYYVTSNSVGNFYGVPGVSVAGGTGAAGYAQLMAAVNAGTVSGTSPLCIGATATYSSDGDAGGTWTSTNTAVATVNASSGLVTAVSAGTTNITYTVGSASAFKALTVSSSVTAGTVTGTTPLLVGATATYTSNGTAGGSWSSSNTSVATVNASSGLVTAIAGGSTNIIYTVNSGCGSPTSAQQALVVNAPNAGTVTGTTPLCIGATATYTSNGDAGGTWASTNTAVATVNASSGLVTAVSAGTTNITYTVNSVSSFQPLTVNPNVTAGTVTGTTPLTVGGTATYTSNGTAGGSWSSSNTAIATVNGSSGLVTAVAAGSTNIIYTVNSGCGSPVSAQQALTVNAPTNAGVVSGTSPLCVGATATYTSNGDAGGSWSSTNTSVATVNASSGLVTAVSVGTTNITYTVNSVSAFKTLTVNGAPSVVAITGATSITVGGTSQLASATAGGVWSSNNTGVATISSGGLVSGVSMGSAMISYAVTNACGTTTVTTNVTVTAQSLMQGSIRSGAASNEVEVWLQPTFSNSTQYLFQIGLPIAFPASATPTSLNVTLDPAFVTQFGDNYAVTVNPVATATGGTEKYFNIVLVRGGVGASTAQTWATGTAFKVLTAAFVPSTAPGSAVKLADYQDGGSDGQGNFYTQDGNANYYVTTNSVGNFFAIPGQSIVGGNASAGYAQTIATIGGCTNPVVDPITGPTAVCAGSAITLSNTTAGGVWSSNATGVATVNASGTVSGVAAGSAAISYAVTNACGTTTVTYGITVNATKSSSFSAAACTTYTLPWGTVVTTSGAYTHTYAAASGCDSVVTANITINQLPTVAAITGATSVQVGGVSQLANTTAGGVWSSSNTGVATISAGGLVTGVSVGSTTISYAVTNGCGTTTVTTTVTVTAQPLIQGSIRSGASANEVEVWLQPNFNNSSEYLFQIGLPIAYPASASPAPTSLNVTLDPAFITQFGNNYTVTVNPVATATGGTEKYLNIVLVRGGVGASTAQTWTAGTAFKVLTAAFVPTAAPGTAVKLADYQDGGSDGQGNFYTQSGNAHYYVTTSSVGNFFAIAGQSTVGGNASAGYAQTIATIGGCTNPVVAPITGPSAVCAGSTITLSSTTSGGVWSSNATGVAIVNASGTVTGVAAGSATISYAVTNACGTTTVTYGITVNATKSSSFTAAACGSYTTPWGTVVTTSGAYTHTYTAASGCDSVVTANVTINTSLASSFNAAACGSYTLPWGTVVTTSGAYTHTYTAVSGCDSVVTANITINQPKATSFSASACGTYTTPWGTVVTTSGAYLHTYTASNGCDSVVTANVTINQPKATSFSASACGSYTTPWGTVVTTSGAYLHTYTASNGCDSVVTANVTIKQPKATSFSASACGSYTTPWGTVVTTSGAYLHTYTASNGCDSVVTANVTITGGLTLTTKNLSLSCGVTSVNLNTGITSSTAGLTVTFYSNVGMTTVIAPVVSAAGTYYVKVSNGSCSATGTIVVTSGDTQLPTITCPGNITASGTACTKSIAVANPVYSDNCSVKTLTWTMTGANNSSSGATGINKLGTKTFNVGVTTVTYTAKDAAGNTATCSFTVRVTETTKPTLSNLKNQTYSTGTTNCSRTVAIPNITAKDNCSLTKLTWQLTGATTGSSPATGINYVGSQTFNLGVTTVTYTVTDASGNTATGSFTVTVKDQVKPDLNCPADIKVPVLSGCSRSITIPNPTYSDNCSVNRLVWAMVGATNGLSPLTGFNFIGTKTFNVGTTIVAYVITDAAGNFTTSSFTVTVEDKLLPVITCPSSITQTAATGKCNKDVSVPNPVFSDNCGNCTTLTWKMTGATTGTSSSSGINYVGTKNFKAGTTTVTYTVKDASGNTATCSFTVKINAASSCTASNSNWDGTVSIGLDVIAWPNPSSCSFTLQVSSKSSEELRIRVTDMTGRLIDEFKGAPNQPIRCGQRWRVGSYIATITQGNQRAVIKLIRH